MNEIQKFKQERKILKAQNGTKIILTKGKEESLGTYNRKIHNGKWTWGQYDNNGNFIPITREVTLNDGTILNTNGSKSSINARKAIMKLRKEKVTPNDGQPDAVVPKKPVKRGAKGTLKSQEQWNNDFQTMLGGLSSQQQMYLDSLGIDMSNAKAMQASINKHYGNNKLVIDNKWGSKSQGALDELLRGMPADYVNADMREGLANEKNIPDQPMIDAPDPFGYKTSNTYEDDDFASKLKRMCIRSNADLMHFMYESKKPNWQGDAWQTQFRSDVDRLLGGDYSDTNIRKVFKTKNGWGNGFMGRGDFGDFQNVLQTNAGVWNGMYDAKEQASRTGASGTVYSSPEMMRKFESIKLQPNQNNQGLTSSTKFDFSNMKFNNIFTKNAGATTLGNIPSTKPQSINLSQEFIKDLTPNNSEPLKLSNT